MSLTTADVKKMLQSFFPEGTGDYLAWNESAADVCKFFNGAAGVWKTYGTDLIDTIRNEVNPTTVAQKIPEWEQTLGLASTPVAMFGTTIQRRNAIISWLRQSGNNSLNDIRALVQPFFLYDNPSQIQILESSRIDQTLLHTYSNTTPLPIVPNGSGSQTVKVLDDPRVSPAGIVLTLNFSAATLDQIRVLIEGPDGTRAGWRGDLYLGTGIVGASQYILRSKVFAGKPIKGTWTLTITTGPGAFVLANWALTPVEGQGVNFDPAITPPGYHRHLGEGLGAALFEFAVVAEEAKLGTGYDLTAALRALRRMKHAHTQCTIVWQARDFVDACAVPDTRSATPDAAIPCT